MLQSIRDRTHGWIAGTIVSLLILSFALWGIHSYFEANASSPVVAKVNGVEITKPQIAVAYERMRRQLQIQYGSNIALPEQAENELKQRALQTLIDIEILKGASLKQDYRVSSPQVDSFLASMPDFKVNGQFSLAKFQQVLTGAMFSASEFLDLIKTTLLIDQPQAGLLSTSFALPDEVMTAVTLINQERNIQYAVLTNSEFSNRSYNISAAAVAKYYKEHQNEFKTPEQVSVEYVELSVKDLIPTINLTDADLRKFYTENPAQFAEPMQWKLAALLLPVADHATEKDIAAVKAKAEQLQHQLTAENFKLYTKQYPALSVLQRLPGWVSINQIPQELQKPLMALAKAGQISSPIKTVQGFVILQALDVKEPKVLAYEQVAAKVKEVVARQQAEEKFVSLKDKLANNSYEHPESLAAVSEVLKLPIKSSELFTKNKGGAGISANAKIREVAFNNDVLNSRNNSDVVQLSADSALVLRIKDHTPAALLSLNNVEQGIRTKLTAIEAEKAAAKTAEEIKQKLAAGATRDQIAQQYHLTWNYAGFIARHVPKVDSAILDEAFSMPAPAEATSATYSAIKVPSGYAVIALLGIQAGKLSKTKDQYSMFEERLQNEQGLLEYELYKFSLNKQADITLEQK